MSTRSASMILDETLEHETLEHETSEPTDAQVERYASDLTALPVVLSAGPPEDLAEVPPDALPQKLPPLFASALAGFLREDAALPLTLFVASDEVLGERTPDRALALTAAGVVFLEAGEVVLGRTHWGVKSLLYPYTQITAVGLGTALLTARFTLHGMGNAPACEIPLQYEDIPRFETAARLIGERIAAGRNLSAG